MSCASCNRRGSFYPHGVCDSCIELYKVGGILPPGYRPHEQQRPRIKNDEQNDLMKAYAQYTRFYGPQPQVFSGKPIKQMIIKIV